MKRRRSPTPAQAKPAEPEEPFEVWFSKVNRERHQKAMGWVPPANGGEVELESPPDTNAASTQPETVSVEEAAKILGVSLVTVYRLIQRGKLRCLKSLRHKRIPRGELERFMKNDLG